MNVEWVKMRRLVENPEEFDLENFIRVNRKILCNKTLSQTQIAGFLNFKTYEIQIIRALPDDYSRNEKLYEYIEKRVNVIDFLEALYDTGNEHVLKFVQFALKNPPISAQTSLYFCSRFVCLTLISVFVLSFIVYYSLYSSSETQIWFNIPEPIDSFCGREDFLSQLHDQLKPQDDSETEVTVLSQVKIVSGLGGIGKTQTARKYIMKQRKFYNNFIWVDAETENSMGNSFLKLAEEIKIPFKNSDGKSREINEIVKEIYNKICEGGKSNLIVFDNAEDYQSCKKFFPLGLHPDLTKPVILATSRNQDWISEPGKIQVLPLDKMTDDESLEFILKQLEIPESEIEEFKEESREFIELIGGLPLALQQAVAFIKREKELRMLLGKSYEIKDYVQDFKLSMAKFLSFSPVPASDSSPTVYITWNVTFQRIQKLDNGELATKLLEVLSFLYADKIPLSFLHDLVPEIKDAEFSAALKLLEKYSLIKTNNNNFSMSIHRQLQFVILQFLKESNNVSKVVMNVVDKSEVILKSLKLSECSDIFLNVHQIVNNPFAMIPVTEKFLDFMTTFGFVLFRASRYSESLEVYKKLYNKYLELLGENHENILATQHQIALSLHKLGRLDEALTLYKQVLRKEEIHLGEDHPLTITTKHNMAIVLRQQGKDEESLELFEQLLGQENKILGENHPLTLYTQISIALDHYQQDDFPKALDLFEQAEKKQAEILGPDHTDVLYTKHNKAIVLFRMGKLEEASKVYNEVHEKEKEILGENHLDTISTLYTIALILEREGKLTEALKMYKKVYEIRKRELAEDDPDIIKVKRKISQSQNIQISYKSSFF